MFRPTFYILLLALAALTLSAACSSPRLQTPASFVELEDAVYGDLTYKAISSDGAVLVVRLKEDQPTGNVDFWSEALTRELTGGRGYEALETVDVRTSLGWNGRLIHLRGTLGEQVYRYDIAVFVYDEDQVITVEAASPESQYEGYTQPFTKAIESLYFD